MTAALSDTEPSDDASFMPNGACLPDDVGTVGEDDLPCDVCVPDGTEELVFEVDVRLIVRRSGSPSHSAALGRGVVQLCRLVESLGSLNKAAAQMCMAYSKAWKTLKHVEERFGFALLQRNGAHGSVLTAQGRALVEAYEQTEAALAASANHEFARAMAKASELEDPSAFDPR